MDIKFSNVPEAAIRQNLQAAFHSLSEAEKLAALSDRSGRREEITKLCECALMLVMATKDMLDNQHDYAKTRITVVLQELAQLSEKPI